MLLGLLVLKSLYYLVFVFIFIVIIRKNKQKYAIWMMIIFAVFYQLFRTNLKIPPSDTYTIIEIDDFYYVGYSNYGSYMIKTDEDLEIGDVIYTDALVIPFEHAQFEGDFDLYSYYQSKGIKGYLNQPIFEVVGKQFVPHLLIGQIMTYLDSLPKDARDFVSSLVFGLYEFEEKEAIGHLGLSHLFVLSGLHVNVIILFLSMVFKPLNQKKKLMAYYVVLSVYLFLTSFPVSLLRAVTQYLIYETLKLKQKPYTRLDALSLSFIGLFFFNPYLIYQLGFILSFIISLFFVLEPPEKGFYGLFKHTLFVQLLVIPFISTFQDRIYPISFLVAPIFMVFFSYVILPLSWASLFRPIAILLNDSFQLIKMTLTWVEKDQFNINLPQISGIYLIGYLVLWVYFYVGYLKNKHFYRLSWLMLYLLIIPSVSLVRLQTTVTFLDVGQGDTTIISSQKGCTIVIDAFGDVYAYLRTKHIDVIDYVIITHGDYDHYKSVFTILDALEVKTLIINPYESDTLFNLIDGQYAYDTVSTGDRISCRGIDLEVLAPIKPYASKNNQSIVIQTRINGVTYLFTGDIEVEAEKDLVEKYGKTLKTDILKVPHHGSSTSSSLLFLKHVNPELAIISAGRENKFNHPHDSVLNRYYELGIKVYQTKLEYTITIISNRDKKYLVLIHK